MKGFTLVELLLTMSIVGFISTGFIVSFKNGDRIYGLQRATQELILQMRTVENYALTGERIVEPDKKVCGYGIIKIDENTFSLYQRHFTATSTALNCASASPLLATTTLTPTFQFKTQDFTKVANTGDFNLFFDSPFAQPSINGVPFDTYTLMLCNVANCARYERSIIITSGGSIYEKK